MSAQPPLRNVGRNTLFAQDKVGTEVALEGHGVISDLTGATLIQTLSCPPVTPTEKAMRLILPAAGFETAARAELEERALQLAGEGFDSCLWAASGSDAMELALWCYAAQSASAVTDLTFLVREGAYHGATALTAALTTRTRLPVAGSSPFNVQLVPEPRAGAGWASEVIEALSRTRGERRVFIVEPVSTTGRCFWPGGTALAEVSAWCNANDVGFICDEVASGTYRHGWFTLASINAGVRPHAILLAKSLTTGIVPLSLCILRNDVAAQVRKAGKRPPGFTVSLNDVSAGIAMDRLDRFERLLASDAFADRSKDVATLASNLRESFGDAVTVETTPTTLRLTTTIADVVAALTQFLRARSIYAYHGQAVTPAGETRAAFLFSPPLDLDAESLARSWQALDGLSGALGSIDLHSATT